MRKAQSATPTLLFVCTIIPWRGWLRGVDLNHRPLGYEANRINDSTAFQRLDAAGNDTKSLERLQRNPIGPQSDHSSWYTLSCVIAQILKSSLFRATLCCVLNNLSDFRWPPKYLRTHERHENRGWRSWVQISACDGNNCEGARFIDSSEKNSTGSSAVTLGIKRCRRIPFGARECRTAVLIVPLLSPDLMAAFCNRKTVRSGEPKRSSFSHDVE
jgi:hypothetical protein